MESKKHGKKLHNEENRMKKLEKELEEKNKSIEDQINTLKRLQADFENYIKRTEKERLQIEIKVKQNLFLEILNIIDTFETAIESLEKIESNKQTLEGVKNIYKQLLKFLEINNVKRLEAVGQKLDPFRHEVIKHMDSEEEENTVIKEIQKGYVFQDYVIRPSKVIISNGKKLVKNNNVSMEVNQNE